MDVINRVIPSHVFPLLIFGLYYQGFLFHYFYSVITLFFSFHFINIIPTEYNFFASCLGFPLEGSYYTLRSNVGLTLTPESVCMRTNFLAFKLIQATNLAINSH